MIKVLLFDLDDTLVNSEAAYEEGLKSLSLSKSHPEFLAARAQVKAELPHLNPVARNRFLYFKKLLEIRGQYSPSRLLEYQDQYEKVMLNHMTQQWQKLERERLFSELLKQGYRLALVTNETTRMQTLKSRIFDPEGLIFKVMVTSEEVGCEKPESHIFEMALKRMKASPSECLMIGDSHVNDVEGALRLGIQPIKTIEFQDDKKSLSGLKVISNLNQVMDVIA